VDARSPFDGAETLWIQKAEGINYTIVNGVLLMQNGEATGALPANVLFGAPGRRLSLDGEEVSVSYSR
jgi:N-acyl-D-aspartate/D-glutamate deacylase